jgi:hypothetical protein
VGQSKLSSLTNEDLGLFSQFEETLFKTP